MCVCVCILCISKREGICGWTDARWQVRNSYHLYKSLCDWKINYLSLTSSWGGGTFHPHLPSPLNQSVNESLMIHVRWSNLYSSYQAISLPKKMRLIKSCHLCTKYKEQQQKNKNKLQTDTLRSSFGIEGSFSLDISNAAVKLLTSTSVPTKADSRRVVNGMLVWTLPSWQWHDNALIICLKMHRKVEMLHLCVCTCHFGPHGERWWM